MNLIDLIYNGLFGDNVLVSSVRQQSSRCKQYAVSLMYNQNETLKMKIVSNIALFDVPIIAIQQ